MRLNSSHFKTKFILHYDKCVNMHFLNRINIYYKIINHEHLYLSLVAAKSMYSSIFRALNTTSNSPLSESKNLCEKHSFANSKFLVFASLSLDVLFFTYNLVLYEHVFMSNEDFRVLLSEKSSCRLNTLSRL